MELAPDRDRRLALVMSVMSLGFCENAVNFLIS